MDNIVRANHESLKSLKIGGHRFRRSIVVAGSASPVVRLEEYVLDRPSGLGKRWVLPLFILMGIGLNMPFAALNGAIVFFSHLFGPSYYLNFLAAFNIPAIPLLTAQLFFDEKLDRRFGSRLMFSIRLLSTFTIMAACTLALPYMVNSFYYVITLISVIGVANGIAFGSIFQLGAIFSAKGTACIFAGLGLGQAFTTVMIFAIHFDDDAKYNSPVVPEFFYIHGLMVFLGMAAILGAVFAKPTRLVLAEKDRVSRTFDPSYAPLLGSTNTDQEDSSFTKSLKPQNGWGVTIEVLGMTWKSQLSMYFTYFTSVTILSFVSYVPYASHWRNDGLFTLIALYVNIYGDFLGKNLTFFPSIIKTDLTLFIVSTLRSLFLPYFFLYITIEDFPRNDGLFLIAMGLVATLGGYLTNLNFTIAPASAPPQYTQQVASMVTIVLHLAVYSSIGASYLLAKYLPLMIRDEPQGVVL